jgi:delta endotoxin, N-terminal domain
MAAERSRFDLPGRCPGHPPKEIAVDLWQRIRAALLAALGEFPYVGAFLEALMDQLLPEEDPADPWDQIKQRVEQLINQKISDEVYQRVRASLPGLQANLSDYLKAAKDPGSPHDLITANFVAARDTFSAAAGNFQEQGYELLLLPLFAQMANMHLALLREGCLHGKDWGWSDANMDDAQNEMTDTLSAYIKHVTSVYEPALRHRSAGVPGDLDAFNRKYGFMQEMRVCVLDYQTLWPNLDPQKFPNPVKVRLNGEIYSDVYGDPRGHPPIDAAPLDYRKPSRIQVWAGTKIDAVKLWYDGKEGPKMGGGGGSLWQGGDFDLSQLGPPTEFWVHPFDALWGLGFGFKNGFLKKMGDFSSWNNPFYPPAGYYISGITAITGYTPDLVRAIYFHYRYDNQDTEMNTILNPGTVFPRDLPFSSGTGAANLVFQSDGNLVVYDENNVGRSLSGGPNPAADHCVFGKDGKLGVYSKDGVIWTSNPGAKLYVQYDGNVVSYGADGRVAWATNTWH